MKVKETLSAILLIIIILSKISYSQIVIKTTKGGEPFEIREIGALIIESEKGMEVAAVIPKDNRPEIYKNIDIERGDKVVMINGKKVKKAKECRDIYEKLPIGDELKLGINRDDKLFLVSIKKTDPKDLPKVKRVIMRKDGKSDVSEEKIPGIKQKRIIKTR